MVKSAADKQTATNFERFFIVVSFSLSKQMNILAFTLIIAPFKNNERLVAQRGQIKVK